LAVAANNDRLAFQRRIVQDLDGNEKCIEVEMGDMAHVAGHAQN
jgi:hypothetical protein